VYSYSSSCSYSLTDDDGDDDDDADDNLARYQSPVSTAKHPWNSWHYAVVQVQGVLSVGAWAICLYRQVLQFRVANILKL